MKKLEETKEMRTKKLLRLLFAMAAIGSSKYVRVSKAEPGDIELIDKNTGKRGAYSIIGEPGLSVEDVSKGGIMDKGKYIDNYTSEEIEKCIQTLRELKIQLPLIIPISVSRFGFNPKYDNLKGYVLWCAALINLVIDRMEMTWLYVRKQKDKEIEWYRSIYNNERVVNFFGNIHSKKELYFQQNKGSYSCTQQKFMKAVQKIFENIIREKDLGIKSQYRELKEKYLSESNEEYKTLHMIYDVLEEIAYPRFLQQLYKDSRI